MQAFTTWLKGEEFYTKMRTEDLEVLAAMPNILVAR